MTIGQAHQLALLNALIKWSLLAMMLVLVAAIAQYTAYARWWKDPVGITIVLLEAFLLIEIVPQEYGQWFVHTVNGAIVIGYVTVGLAELVTLGLAWRMIVWRWIKRHPRRGGGEKTGSGGP